MSIEDITGSFGPGAFDLNPSTGGVNQGFRIGSSLPPLSAAQQAALASRRNIATRTAQQTGRFLTRERQRAEGDVLRRVGDVGRRQQTASRQGMNTLAGRGVARGPMFVNPLQRELARAAQQETAELYSDFAGLLSNLENALRQAEITRDREYSQIFFDEASMRSDLERLMSMAGAQ